MKYILKPIATLIGIGLAWELLFYLVVMHGTYLLLGLVVIGLVYLLFFHKTKAAHSKKYTQAINYKNTNRKKYKL